jgi:hypothetical protein
MSERSDPRGWGYVDFWYTTASRSAGWMFNPSRHHGYTDANKAACLKWRREHPNAMFSWTIPEDSPSPYGCVVAFWGQKIYYARCQCVWDGQKCGALVTKRRPMSYMRHEGSTDGTGAWPKYCQPCRDRKRREHDAGAPERMRRKRAERRKFREEQLQRKRRRDQRMHIETATETFYRQCRDAGMGEPLTASGSRSRP